MSEGGYRDLAWLCKTLTHPYLNFLNFVIDHGLSGLVIIPRIFTPLL